VLRTAYGWSVHPDARSFDNSRASVVTLPRPSPWSRPHIVQFAAAKTRKVCVWGPGLRRRRTSPSKRCVDDSRSQAAQNRAEQTPYAALRQKETPRSRPCVCVLGPSIEMPNFASGALGQSWDYVYLPDITTVVDRSKNPFIKTAASSLLLLRQTSRKSVPFTSAPQ